MSLSVNVGEEFITLGVPAGYVTLSTKSLLLLAELLVLMLGRPSLKPL